MSTRFLAALLLAPACSVPMPEPGIQVIGAGVSRTSTQSLSLALNILGYKTLHAEGFHPKIPLYNEAPDLVDLVTKAARKSFQDEDFGVLLPALERIEQLKVTALVDIPWSEYGVELHQKYPQAKIILTVREKQGWFRSYWEHFRWGALLPPPPFPSFPISQPFPFTVLHQPFAQYWRLVSQRLGCGAITQFPPWIVSADEKQRCLHGFDEHIESLKKAVAPEKLLIYNIREGWDPLCHFLELPVPVGIPFPREDSYSVLHWRSGPVTFLSFVYLCYGLYCLCLSLLFVRLLSRCRQELQKKD